MDIEKDKRSEFIDLYSEWFDFEEQVALFSLPWKKGMQADLIMTPKRVFSQYSFVVEVKNKEYWKPANYADAIAQASFYNYCRIEEGSRIGRLVSVLFLHKDILGIEQRENEKDQLWGIEVLAQRLRVGIAETQNANKKSERRVLRFGPNEFWRSDLEFNTHSENMITGKRIIGGTRISFSKVIENVTNN